MEKARDCNDGCQYAADVAMPEYHCVDYCWYRFQPCSRCGGEGRIYSGHANDPNPRDEGECEVCNGTGREPLELPQPPPVDAGDEIAF